MKKVYIAFAMSLVVLIGLSLFFQKSSRVDTIDKNFFQKPTSVESQTEHESDKQQREYFFTSTQNILDGRRKVKIITLNTFNSAQNVDRGLEKLAKFIVYYQPDIISLQETYKHKIGDLMKLLPNDTWTFCSKTNGNNYVLTRWKVAFEYEPAPEFYNQGCKIEIKSADMPKSLFINIWNIHLPFKCYGPSAACSMPQTPQNIELLYECEFISPGRVPSRMRSMELLFKHSPFVEIFRKTKSEPLVIMGDFNAASHLDWIESAKYRHCNWTFVWPVSQMLERNGFIDTYRHLHVVPDTSDFTWPYGIARKTDEPPERLDFMQYHKDSDIQIISSDLITEKCIKDGDTPLELFTDHKGLFTVFAV